MSVSAQEIGRTYDCRKANCDQEARTNRGTYAYLCDFHAEQRKRELGHGDSVPARAAPRVTEAAASPNGSGPAPSLEGDLARLRGLAKKADRLRQKQYRIAETVRAAKAAADAAEREYRDALAQAVNGGAR